MDNEPINTKKCDVNFVSWRCTVTPQNPPESTGHSQLKSCHFVLHSESVCCLHSLLLISLCVFLLLLKYLPICFPSYICLLADLEFPVALLSWIWCDFWLCVVKDLHSRERAWKGAKKQTDTHSLSNMSQVQILTYKYISM